MRLLPPDFLGRAGRLLNLGDFDAPSAPVPIVFNDSLPDTDHQYVLRMMVRGKRGRPLSIPPELAWLAPRIRQLDRYQKQQDLRNPYIYVTVRHGIVESETDDEWHVDGFSMRTPHVPEQNYICAAGEKATQFLVRSWHIPQSFDPFVHNIHHFFRDFCGESPISNALPGVIYAIDPYCVHRRPPGTAGKMRTFWRISFVPIEIEDDTCAQNPLFPVKHYGREDIRKQLVAWRAS